MNLVPASAISGRSKIVSPNLRSALLRAAISRCRRPPMMSSGVKLSQLSSPTPSHESQASSLSRASTIERDLNLLTDQGSESDAPASEEDEDEGPESQPIASSPHLVLLLDIFRKELPASTCDAIQRLVDRVSAASPRSLHPCWPIGQLLCCLSHWKRAMRHFSLPLHLRRREPTCQTSCQRAARTGLRATAHVPRFHLALIALRAASSPPPRCSRRTCSSRRSSSFG